MSGRLSRLVSSRRWSPFSWVGEKREEMCFAAFYNAHVHMHVGHGTTEYTYDTRHESTVPGQFRLCDCGAVEDELHVFDGRPAYKSIRAKYDGDLVIKGRSMRLRRHPWHWPALTDTPALVCKELVTCITKPKRCGDTAQPNINPNPVHSQPGPAAAGPPSAAPIAQGPLAAALNRNRSLMLAAASVAAAATTTAAATSASGPPAVGIGFGTGGVNGGINGGVNGGGRGTPLASFAPLSSKMARAPPPPQPAAPQLQPQYQGGLQPQDLLPQPQLSTAPAPEPAPPEMTAVFSPLQANLMNNARASMQRQHQVMPSTASGRYGPLGPSRMAGGGGNALAAAVAPLSAGLAARRSTAEPLAAATAAEPPLLALATPLNAGIAARQSTADPLTEALPQEQDAQQRKQRKQLAAYKMPGWMRREVQPRLAAEAGCTATAAEAEVEGPRLPPPVAVAAPKATATDSATAQERIPEVVTPLAAGEHPSAWWQEQQQQVLSCQRRGGGDGASSSGGGESWSDDDGGRAACANPQRGGSCRSAAAAAVLPPPVPLVAPGVVAGAIRSLRGGSRPGGASWGSNTADGASVSEESTTDTVVVRGSVAAAAAVFSAAPEPSTTGRCNQAATAAISASTSAPTIRRSTAQWPPPPASASAPAEGEDADVHPSWDYSDSRHGKGHRSPSRARCSSGSDVNSGDLGSCAKAALDQLMARFASRDPLEDSVESHPLTANCQPSGAGAGGGSGGGGGGGGGWMAGIWPFASPSPSKRNPPATAAAATATATAAKCTAPTTSSGGAVGGGGGDVYDDVQEPQPSITPLGILSAVQQHRLRAAPWAETSVTADGGGGEGGGGGSDEFQSAEEDSSEGNMAGASSADVKPSEMNGRGVVQPILLPPSLQAPVPNAEAKSAGPLPPPPPGPPPPLPPPLSISAGRPAAAGRGTPLPPPPPPANRAAAAAAAGGGGGGMDAVLGAIRSRAFHLRSRSKSAAGPGRKGKQLADDAAEAARSHALSHNPQVGLI
ncbi:hypothetical protein VOLCADRAFT_91504 [Volvox carteri f. nagariensis]|uniref:Uncharacterized protein n=1 Tax=Volvox carteri f. nagariensis TaxID=3068 RepID=D8TX89_VOLCA|nr:uncharacterized protein VOLCADRAFT_91504 [Volvox carteri f. nagariensis]EFJ47965.1 hypothetical protein VOLCADRAFT_91504 [Volvox carteri f. nagariensis]|eukprot:XP_002951071.1 hypothetical protein VOLCADRAFT_91504 [Volvox carteri f. nagariensis]